MNKREEKKYVTCPICGSKLMRCLGKCEIELNCTKCKEHLLVQVDSEGVSTKSA